MFCRLPAAVLPPGGPTAAAGGAGQRRPQASAAIDRAPRRHRCRRGVRRNVAGRRILVHGHLCKAFVLLAESFSAPRARRRLVDQVYSRTSQAAPDAPEVSRVLAEGADLHLECRPQQATIRAQRRVRVVGIGIGAARVTSIDSPPIPPHPFVVEIFGISSSSAARDLATADRDTRIHLRVGPASMRALHAAVVRATTHRPAPARLSMMRSRITQQAAWNFEGAAAPRPSQFEALGPHCPCRLRSEGQVRTGACDAQRPARDFVVGYTQQRNDCSAAL